MSDPTICPTHQFPYRICVSCCCIFCLQCLSLMKHSTTSSGAYCPRCGSSARVANNYEVERYRVSDLR